MKQTRREQHIVQRPTLRIYRMCLFQSPEPAVVKPEPKRNGTSSNKNNQHVAKNLGSKFHDVQRKWMLSPPPLGESDSSDIDLQDSIRIGTPSSAAFPLGHSSVKCLSSKFQKQSSTLPSQNGGQNGGGNSNR